MKVAAVHSYTIYNQVEKNIEELGRLLYQLESQKVNFAFFPELNITGYVKGANVLRQITSNCKRIFQEIARLSERYNLSFAVGIPELSNTNYYISHYLFSKGVILGKHRKTHLGPSEQNIYSSGNQVNVFSMGQLNIGIQLCFETHIPEIAYAQAKRGANVLCMAYASPKENGSEKMERLIRFLSARAYDNACYVLACNMAAIGHTETYFPGLSMIIDPKGKVICRSNGDHSGYCTAQIDLGLTDKIKNSRMAWFNNFKRDDFLKTIYNKET